MMLFKETAYGFSRQSIESEFSRKERGSSLRGPVYVSLTKDSGAGRPVTEVQIHLPVPPKAKRNRVAVTDGDFADQFD